MTNGQAITTCDSQASALTSRQERFAQLIASGKCQAEAYREAYPKSREWNVSALYPAASRMMAKSKVRARVAALRVAVPGVVQCSLAEHIQELSRLKHVAVARSNLAAAIRAEELRGRASGLYVE